MGHVNALQAPAIIHYIVTFRMLRLVWPVPAELRFVNYPVLDRSSIVLFVYFLIPIIAEVADIDVFWDILAKMVNVFVEQVEAAADYQLRFASMVFVQPVIPL